MAIGLLGSSTAVTCAGYPQEGVDAALADFAALAGDANGALLREYVAAVLGRATAAPGSGGGAGGSGPSADLAAAGGGLTAAAATPEATQPASGAADPAATGAAAEAAAAEPAATAGSSGAHTARGGSGGGRGSGAPRAPMHVLLEPMPEKQKRSAVHAFFKTEARLPPMRTETAPSSVKTGNNTVSVRRLLPGSCPRWVATSGYDRRYISFPSMSEGLVSVWRVQHSILPSRARLLWLCTKAVPSWRCLAVSAVRCQTSARVQRLQIVSCWVRIHMQAPSEGVIQVSAAPKRKRGGGGRGGGGSGGCRENWPGGDAWYVRFVMRKENMDTQVGHLRKEIAERVAVLH